MQYPTHLNIVTCGACGEVFGHIEGVEELHCPYCGHHSDICEFPDLYYSPEHDDSLISIIK